MSVILVLVGTDHHPFERAVSWADDRQQTHPQDRVFIQYGKSREPRVATGEAFVSPQRLRELVAEADVVIAHGGPGTISDARQAGHRPIVFPRDPQYGEHVDDHQMRFAAWCARRGIVISAPTRSDLDKAVSSLGLSGTRGLALADPAVQAAVARVGELVDGLIESPVTARRRSIRRLLRIGQPARR